MMPSEIPSEQRQPLCRQRLAHRAASKHNHRIDKIKPRPSARTSHAALEIGGHEIIPASLVRHLTPRTNISRPARRQISATLADSHFNHWSLTGGPAATESAATESAANSAGSLTARMGHRMFRGQCWRLGIQAARGRKSAPPPRQGSRRIPNIPHIPARMKDRAAIQMKMPAPERCRIPILVKFQQVREVQCISRSKASRSRSAPR